MEGTFSDRSKKAADAAFRDEVMRAQDEESLRALAQRKGIAFVPTATVERMKRRLLEV